MTLIQDLFDIFFFFFRKDVMYTDSCIEEAIYRQRICASR